MGTEKRTDCDSMSRLEVRPISLKAANRFVEANHRHHKKVVGCKFSICACRGRRDCRGCNLRETSQQTHGRRNSD